MLCKRASSYSRLCRLGVNAFSFLPLTKLHDLYYMRKYKEKKTFCMIWLDKKKSVRRRFF